MSFLFSLEDLPAEKNQIHHDEEHRQNNQSENGLFRRQNGQKHHRKSEHDGGNVLIDQVIRHGGIVIGIQFSEENYASAGGAGKHAVHCEKLLLRIGGKQLAGDVSIIIIGNKQTGNAQNQHDSPIVFQHVQADSGDTGDNHDIEKEAADALHKEHVDVLSMDKSAAAEDGDHRADKRGNKDTDKEVKAIQDGAQTGQEIAEGIQDQICNEIGGKNPRHLDTDFIHTAVHGNLVAALDVVHGEGIGMFTAPVDDFVLLFEDIEVHNTADACAEEAQGSDRKPEGFTAGKGVVRFVDVAIVQRLAGSLPEPEGEQNAGGRKEIGDKESGNDRDAHAEHALEKVGGNGGNAGIEDLAPPFGGQLLTGGLEGGSDETDGQSVVGNHFQRLHTVSAEKRGIEQHPFGNGLINNGSNQKKNAAENRRRNQRITKKRYGSLQHIGGKKAQKEDGDQVDTAPYTIVPEILHLQLLSPHWSALRHGNKD